MNKLERKAVADARYELVTAISQMIDKDDKIICNHVRRAEGMLRSILTLSGGGNGAAASITKLRAE